MRPRCRPKADVRIARVDPRHVYAGMDLPHRFAIMLAIPMAYPEMRHAATFRHITEVMRTYVAVGRAEVAVATWLQDRGHDARPHSLRFEQLNMIPHAVAAGLGEMGKHGSLIHRTLGSSFRLAAVTTDLPLAIDGPEDHGVERLCANCTMCVSYCPGEALGHEKAVIRGDERWFVDTERCAPYWGSHHACGVCLAVCPFNARGFDGAFKSELTALVRSKPAPEWKAELQATLEEPWATVDPPTVREPGWRNQVRRRADLTDLIHGIPREGLPAEIYRIRELMGLRVDR